ncbi:uncharacterized protein METZ01_LOCUS120795 [marine metagenome]|uniref:Uncharacterized protein n=1 Tax=marine metagenome TaxID=408172 RepID=A0A381XU55_9ZZZZ
MNVCQLLEEMRTLVFYVVLRYFVVWILHCVYFVFVNMSHNQLKIPFAVNLICQEQTVFLSV